MRLCDECGEKITYYSKKRRRTVSSDDHTLCNRCYGSLVSSSFGTGKSGIEYYVEANRKVEAQDENVK